MSSASAIDAMDRRMANLFNHHFEKKGWQEPRIVIRFWIIAVILALIGLSTLKLR